MVWKIDAPQGNESAKIKWELVRYTRGRGLDLGCGPNKAFAHFIGVDNYSDTAKFGIEMRPDVVCNVQELMFGSASMDFVYSSHCLEHIEAWQATLREWWRVVKQNGFMILYLPDETLYPKIGEEGANPDHKWDVNAYKIIECMKGMGGWSLQRNEKRSEGFEYSLFMVFQKRGDKKQVRNDLIPKPSKTCAITRFGGIGDMVQMTSILPALKEQGFHVTLYTTPRGADVVRHEPMIDEFYVQDTDQVPNAELGPFWEHERKKFDRWVNLSESVERSFLALPGSTQHAWPHAARHAHLNKNYYDMMHLIAEVPMPPKPRFYATPEEKEWAKKQRAKIGGDFLMMYSLAGSSVHKIWPHMDGFIARVLVTMPGARVLTVGDEFSQMLERGWESEPRVIRKAGKYTVRESLSLLAECDMVVGPETGMLNAAAHLRMPKICIMSHSSPENLTKYWLNTASVEPQNTACYPCHRMVYGFEFCNRDDATGVAACAADVSLDQVWQAFDGFMRKAA
jgi:ADP-heptose:LPS heptosyltransferase/predicted SAM-dependent methyltransferase